MKVWKTCSDFLKWLSAGTGKGKCPAKGFGPAAAGESCDFLIEGLLNFIFFLFGLIIAYGIMI